MATITLKYDSRNTVARKTIELIRSLGVFTFVEKNGIDESIEDIKKGKINKYDSVEDFFKKIKVDV